MANQYEAVGRSYENTWPKGIKRMNDLAKQLVKEGDLPQDFTSGVRSEKISSPEPIVLRERFTPQERKVIEDAHGVIYTPTGLSLDAQKSARAAKNKPSFPYDLSWGGERLTAVASRQVEMAVFPDPQEFFVPGSFGNSTATQERMAAEDAKRLGLPNVTQILPDEASTFTDIVFQHEDATDKWLFGPEYAKAQNLDWVYGRTKNPTNSSGSNVASVGYAGADGGVSVDDSGRDIGHHGVGAVRLVVPLETK